MKAAYIKKYGHDPLTIGERPAPEVGPEDVLIQIKAASVNPIDFKMRDGKLKVIRPIQFPFILGHDCAGQVVQVGNKVSNFKIGDAVFSRPRSGRIGTFAEFIAVDQSDVAKMPGNISFEQAASIPLVGLTSVQALQDVANLRPGQKVLIQAGAGGIGTFAIQFAKHLGAEVWTTTSSKNIDFVKSLGADHIINYQQQSFETVVSNIDVVFDTLGGEALDKAFSVVKPGGWVISISGTPDYETGQDMELGFWKSLLLGLVGLKTNLKAKKAGVQYRFIFMKANGHQLSYIASLIEKGKIEPIIDKVFPLAECQAALDYSETGRARGKIIVSI
ncbi:NADP-dependent oxidoreductase [Bdellovibrio sp. SKB1291214]|uniref:NADP-dependent oxidoreductase n=1 Tax=Bdellovibrio sp. SKB1291214 TaxID=1732569 RepID=UPI000B51D1F2|nr:NADP-dependent oxidoreductase [Bdellovibrio sp. SKB1291214]UYL08508.1 NADP-dependent oxidoreductase [Bdellovibrio sp. SKB1291214]